MATKDRTSLKNDFANGKYATGEKFADLIDSMKVVQLPVVDPQALGTSLTFIDSISQDADGKITVTKKTVMPTVGSFRFVANDATAEAALTTYGATYSSAISGVSPSADTKSVILLMNDDDTTPTKTMMIATQSDGNNGYQFVYVGDLDSALPTDVINAIEDVNVGSQATLALAIAAVPDALKKAGLTVTYYDTTASKWVAKQYIGTTTEGWSTESNWENAGVTFATGEKVGDVGIDNEPTAGSNNLVKSGGVYEKVSRLDQKVDGFVEEVNSEDYSEVLIDAENKILESRDLAGKKTIYTDVEVKGQVTGEHIPEITVRPATEFVDAVIDKDGNVVEGTRRNGAKVFFGGIETDDKVPFKTSILYRKKWAVLGDSFTNGGVSNTSLQEGKYKGQRAVYPYIIGNRTGIEVLKFFEGGRTLAWPANPGTFTNSICNPNANFYYQNIPADVDYITIYLGINDIGHAEGQGGDGEDYTGVIPLGTASDNTTATYYGAWNVVLSWLRENRPYAHIGIIVCNCGSSPEYRTAQVTMAQKYGYLYLDLNGDDRCPAMLRSCNTNIPSSVREMITQIQSVDYPTNKHPNMYAHYLESTFIENFLKSI